MLLGAIVLAGGRSRRMGQPKEALAYGDTTLLWHTAETLAQCCHPVLVVARDPEQALPPLPIETDLVYDEQPDEGPLVGIATGLRALQDRCDAAFVTTCDAPQLTEAAVAWLANRLGEHDAVLPRVGAKLQPLTAIYRTSVLPTVDALIAEGERRPRMLTGRVAARVLDEAEVDAFDPDRRFLRNINSPADYQAALDDLQRGA